MLPYLHRLRQEKEILLAQRSKFFATNHNFKVVLAKSNVKEIRFCFIVSKKTLRKANKRHRIKRRVMGMLEVKLHRQEFKMQYSSFVIFCKNKEALHIKPIELEQQLDLLLQEAICKRQAFFQKQRDNSAYGGKSRPITPSSRISSSVEQ